MTPPNSGAGVPPVVKFPHRSRRGVLLGMSAMQLATAGLGLVLVMGALTSGGVILALQLAPALALLAGLIWTRRGGIPLTDWMPVLARYGLRRLHGQLEWLARPATRPAVAGLLHLPGAAGSLRLITAPSGHYAAIHDPHARTLTVVVRVASRAFALLDPATQNAHVHGWGRALAALARTGHIRSVQVLERTVPDSGDALVRHFTEHGRPEAGMAVGVYRDLVEAAGPAAAPHESYVALAFDLKAARRLINQAGGGLSGAFMVLNQLVASFNQAARGAGIYSLGWLDAQEIAAVIRTAYDPKALPALQRWSPTTTARAAPAAAGPVVQIEEPGLIRTDTAVHCTYWIENWPRTETSPGFLHQVMFTSGVRRSVSLTYRPASIDAALRDVQRRKAGIVAEAAERQRRGRVDSEAHSMEYADVQERERQLIAGHADVAFTGLVTVSADTTEALHAACAQIETAAVSAQIDLRRLTYRQAEAFTAAALPLALAA
ncbi:SCO6880 family protein [Streptomyces sp. NPDC127098]|uniref:SCO6880 family protein n=1 Tax=Streptomyces sp. NPDC127098 TaxID=3347137 RepID=UPI00365BEA64